MGTAGFDDDASFRNLSQDKGIKLNKLSYHCANLLCKQCDGAIHYRFMKEVEGFDKDSGYISAKTGEYIPKRQEMFDWDPQFGQVQLSGEIQTKINAPEGSKCMCFCHRRPNHPDSIGKMEISQYNQNELAPEVTKSLQ